MAVSKGNWGNTEGHAVDREQIKQVQSTYVAREMPPQPVFGNKIDQSIILPANYSPNTARFNHGEVGQVGRQDNVRFVDHVKEGPVEVARPIEVARPV